MNREQIVNAVKLLSLSNLEKFCMRNPGATFSGGGPGVCAAFLGAVGCQGVQCYTVSVGYRGDGMPIIVPISDAGVIVFNLALPGVTLQAGEVIQWIRRHYLTQEWEVSEESNANEG